MPMRGIPRFSIDNLLSHSTENLRRETLLCFTKFLVSKKFMDQEGGGGVVEYYDFPSKLFCLTVPKYFLEEPFCVSERFRYRKILWIRGEYQDFLPKICCFTVPRNFVGESICVSETSGYRSFWIKGGGGKECHEFTSQIFCFTVPKNFVREPFSVSLISDLEKFYA